MSNYTKQISWSGKDALSDSDSEKVISGGDFDTEFSAVQTAINSKIDDIVDDTTPQLGGDLDFQTHKATSFTSTGIDDNATSTAITIDASENVGIGNTAANDHRLEITDAVNVSLTSGGAGSQFAIVGAGYTGYFALDGTSFQIGQASSARSITFHSGTGMPERMRIDPSGNVMVGTTAVSTDSGIQLYKSGHIYTHIDGTANAQQLIFYRNNSVVGNIATTGTSTSYVTSSDYRLKENVVPMTGSIDRLKDLKPSRFNFKADTDKTVDGFLAHEAGEVVPECATGTKDGMIDEEYEVTPAVMDGETVVTEAVMGTRSVPDYQGIDQSKLVPLLVASLQEAVAKIEALEARVTALEV